MRFNPKARLDTGRVGDAGRGGGGGLGGGRGSAPMRIPLPGGAKAGGGLGGLVIIILFVALTQCSGGGGIGLPGDTIQDAGSDTSRMGEAQRYANCRTGADANDDVDCARVAVENSLYAFWRTTLPEQGGTQFSPAEIITFAGGIGTGCGQASSQVGPFYCPADRHVYLDTSFFADVLEGQLGGQGGDFVEPYVLGHEYGHHIQNLLGTMGRVRTQKGADSDAVRLELQADCYAGMWTRAASQTTDVDGTQIFEGLDQGDISEALDAAQTVGDDRIQQTSGQRVNPEGWTHGSSEQRMRWFTVGLEQGSLQACDTFSASSL